MRSQPPTIRSIIIASLCCILTFSSVILPPVKAADNTPQTTERGKPSLSGEDCTKEKFCIYTESKLQSGIASLSIIPRFYHMAIDCYLQAAIMGTKRYYDMTARDKKPFTQVETGFGGEWRLASFCTNEVKDTHGRVLNAHVIKNTKLLYAPQITTTSTPQESAVQEDNPLNAFLEFMSPGGGERTKKLINQNTQSKGTSALHTLLEQYERRTKAALENKKSTENSAVDSPERLVSDILWKEYLAYAKYMSGLQRDPSEVVRSQQWINTKVSPTAGNGTWSMFLRDQIESVGKADAGFDAHVARTTRHVADVMYEEFVRTYAEHLQYLMLEENLKEIGKHLDSMERALGTLSVKLRDAFVTGN